MNENGGEFMNESCKAYLPIKRTSETMSRALFISKTNGVKNVVTQGEKEALSTYNIAGQRVSDSYRGVVITNGKKVVR